MQVGCTTTIVDPCVRLLRLSSPASLKSNNLERAVFHSGLECEVRSTAQTVARPLGTKPRRRTHQLLVMFKKAFRRSCCESLTGSDFQLSPRVQIVEDLGPRDDAIHVMI